METAFGFEIKSGTATINIDRKTFMIFSLMLAEIERADKKYHDDRMSPEEIEASLKTVQCEMMELEREVRRIKKRPDLMTKEAIQLMAMSYKFLRDVCFAKRKECLLKRLRKKIFRI